MSVPNVLQNPVADPLRVGCPSATGSALPLGDRHGETRCSTAQPPHPAPPGARLRTHARRRPPRGGGTWRGTMNRTYGTVGMIVLLVLLILVLRGVI